MKNTDAYELWKDPPARIYRKFYLFDLQNPKEVQNGEEKPNFVQRGPYVKFNIFS